MNVHPTCCYVCTMTTLLLHFLSLSTDGSTVTFAFQSKSRFKVFSTLSGLTSCEH
ncbi:hypothetical protein E3U43_005922 [Larimichthys crocea]|uniref:Uncharacterized protein n=1 Tax=Larimichthys crocea TaxID=215358 RepID=A0ACD3QNL0_LARCR|nr:hypothetical protein E3U43_005922 [Larimichthys crocea]